MEAYSAEYFKKLAHDIMFDVSDDEVVELQAEFKELLSQIDVLNEIDTEGVEEMIYPVFKEINYLTYEEMKGFNSRIVTYGKEKAAVRQKRKGDALTENGMYVNAIRVYQKLLEREDLSEQRKGFAASVRYNLGCAYSYLFQMEKAQECFLEAYREAHSKDALKAYIIAYSSVHDKTDYDKVMEELKVDEELKKDIKEEIRQSLKAFESVPEEKTDEKNLDALLERLMKDYHRSTGS